MVYRLKSDGQEGDMKMMDMKEFRMMLQKMTLIQFLEAGH